MSGLRLDTLRSNPRVRLAEALDARSLGLLLPSFQLPHEHIHLLKFSNGLTVADGYIRMYGVAGSAPIDALEWNHPGFWRFAWQNLPPDYWFFGGTAVGDQYAYQQAKGLPAQVVKLDCFEMSVAATWRTFADFWTQEVAESIEHPSDALLAQVRDRIGPIDAGESIVFTPPPLIAGRTIIDGARRVSSRLAMIINGDIATQMQTLPEGAIIKRLSDYIDELGRARVRIET